MLQKSTLYDNRVSEREKKKKVKGEREKEKYLSKSHYFFNDN